MHHKPAEPGKVRGGHQIPQNWSFELHVDDGNLTDSCGTKFSVINHYA